MPFNEKSRLDTSQVEDRRGQALETVVAAGGGGFGLVLLVVAPLLGLNPGDLAGVTAQATSASAPNASEINNLAEECQTGADANTRQNCRVVGFVNSIQAFWTGGFARRGGSTPQPRQSFSRGQRRPLVDTLLLRWSRSTVRTTKTSIWTSSSSTNCRRALALGAARLPKRTCWLTSTVITCRTSPVRWARRVARRPRGRTARQFRLNSRLTAWPASGRTTPPKQAT